MLIDIGNVFCLERERFSYIYENFFSFKILMCFVFQTASVLCFVFFLIVPKIFKTQKFVTKLVKLIC